MQNEQKPVQALKAHLALNVKDVEVSLEFYRRLLGIEPSKVRTGYAKFDVHNPPLNLTLNQHVFNERGALSHLGIQVASTDDVLAIRERRCRAELRGAPEAFILAKQHRRLGRIAKPERALGDGPQHRLHVSRRSGDDAQYFADRRLLLERFLRLVKQTHVVDRDRRLARERLDQRHLVGREQSRHAAEQEDGTVRAAFAQ